MEDGDPVFTVDDALLALGFGKYQWFLLVYSGMGWVAEAMEMMLLSFVGPAVHVEWGLSPNQESMITSVVFLGMMVGAYLWGMVSDSRGRRYGFFVTSVITFIAGMLSAFSPNYLALVVTRCFVGLGLGGGPVLSSWFLEFIPTSNRGFWMIVFQATWTIGTLLEASLAWIVMPKLGWRWLLGLSSVPSLVLLLFYGAAPESPRYLAMKGRTEDALTILEKIAYMNSKQLPAGKLVSNISTELREIDNFDVLEESHLLNAATQSNESPVKLKSKLGVLSSSYCLFSPNFIKSTLLLWCVFFANAFTYYGLVLLTSELSGGGGNCGSKKLSSVTYKENNLYRDVFISSFGEFPGLVLAAVIVDYLGRKLSMAVMFSSCGVFLIPLIFPQHELIRTCLLFGARLCINGAFAIVYVYAPEIYPTSIRSTGFGAASSFARIGGMICPLIAVTLVANCHQALAILLFESVLLVAVVSIMLFPLETKGRALSDSDDS